MLWNSTDHKTVETTASYFNWADFPILTIAYMYNAEFSKAGLSFILSNSTSRIFCAGSCGCPVISPLDAAIKAFKFASQVMNNWSPNIMVKTILLTSKELLQCIQRRSESDDWRFNCNLQDVTEILAVLGNPSLHAIPWSWSIAPHSLACHGLSHHEVSLFHSGRELPRWLMKMFKAFGFI